MTSYATQPPLPHPHHWVIASPNGETSEGRCKVCGSVREFCNFDPRDDTRPAPNSIKMRAMAIKKGRRIA